MIAVVQKLLVKAVLTVLLIIGVLAGVRQLADSLQSTNSVSYLLTDPALDRLAAPEPAELKGLASRLTQFTTVQAAAKVVETAGYRCDLAEATASGANRQFVGQRQVVCPEGEEGLLPGRRVLLLQAHYPGGFLRSVHLKRVPDGASSRDELLAAPSIAVAGGIVFPDVSKFADFIADRFHHRYHALCFEEQYDLATRRNCEFMREERQRTGLPQWKGQAVAAGRYEEAIHTLRAAGFECTALREATTEEALGPDLYLASCRTQTFAGRPLAVALRIDARNTHPHSLQVVLGEERQVIPLTGRDAVDNSPGAVSVMVQWQGSDIRAISVSPNPWDGGSHQVVVREFPRMNEASRRRVVAVALAQVAQVLAVPNDPTLTPLLQRLDLAAGLLARFGSSGVIEAQGQLSPGARDTTGAVPDTSMIAVLALAKCRVDFERTDCLAPYLIAHPSLRGVFVSAADEARASVQGLPDSYLAHARLALLERQMAVVTK